MTTTTDMQSLRDLMARLRAPEDGCDWCREQTFASISHYTLEEAFEVADAIAGGNRAALCDELGDLEGFFQSVVTDTGEGLLAAPVTTVFWRPEPCHQIE